EYADSAAEAAPHASPRLTAFLRGQQAHASAMVGDRRGAVRRLKEAESALSQADSRRDAVGGYDQAAFLFHVSHVHYETRDIENSIKALRRSIRVMSPLERQGRLHAHAVLAQRQHEIGHLEESCTSWERFLDDYEALSTARGDEHFDKLRALNAPRRSPVARRLQDRIHAVAKLKAA
ncbi:transcriptional regulator, partial [Streptomyces cavourensis]